MASKPFPRRLDEPHRPTIALILLATVIQALAVATLLGMTIGRVL